MSRYLDRIRERPLIFDGAMGTMLYHKGVFINASYEELVVTRSELILDVHREYAAAGADVILTNTFGANRMKLREFGLAERTAEINKKAVELARASGDVLVAGDIGPCSKQSRGMQESLVAEVRAAFEEQASVLAEAKVDLIFLETFADLKEIEIAAHAARALNVPVHASFTVTEEGMTPLGVSAAAVVRALSENPDIDTIGLNCSVGPAAVFDLAESLVDLTEKPFVVKPNAGFPREVGGRMLYMASPEYFTEYAKKFIEIGVRGVGGCCGTTPAHIREMAKAIKNLSGVKKHASIVTVSAEAKRAVAVTPPEKKSRFAAKLVRGEKVTSIEILPPKSANMNAMFDKVRQCHYSGIDAINIPDGPRASSRVSPMIASILIKNTIGIEPIPHYSCRDRNLLGMQSDILGGFAAGLTNYLVITGDPPKSGDGPDISGVFDVDAVGLTQLINNLNHGHDFGGNPIDPPTGIFIGVGANPCAVDMDREIERYFKKIDAGAEYAITQPVFDAPSLLKFLDTVDKYTKRIPVIAGMWPLASYKNAEFMRNEVPGVVIPDKVMERLAKCNTKEESRDEGIAIAREMIDEIDGRVSGYQVSAPMGNVDTALRVLEGKAI
ncbi:MAG: bifunctional homocysteine S-methyltransferase/methylenetetrahydrofolate reductase [Spirochaetota bacterium]